MTERFTIAVGAVVAVVALDSSGNAQEVTISAIFDASPEMRDITPNEDADVHVYTADGEADLSTTQDSTRVLVAHDPL